MNKQKIQDLISILEKIRENYENGYFVYEFDKLLKDEEIDKIPVDNNKWQKLFKINPYFEPIEVSKNGEVYLETVIYLFALWAYKYITGEDYSFEDNLRKVKYPGLFQFFQKTIADDFRDRLNDFDELELYLEIALEDLENKFYKNFENQEFFVEGITTVGMKRYENQDSFDFFYKDGNLLAIVADGMGGGSDGGVASRLAVNIFKNKFEELIKINNEETDDFLKNIVLEINQKIINYKNKHGYKSMGTTVSVILIKPEKTFFAHVGDSRIYIKYKNSNEYEQITLDHSLAEVRYRNGEITEEEKEKIAKNILAYVVGSEKLKKDVINTTQDYKEILTKDIDEVILCSDGCWDLVEPDYFKEDVRRILQRANSYITHDNTTVIKIKKKENKKENCQDNKEEKPQKDAETENNNLPPDKVTKPKKDLKFILSRILLVLILIILIVVILGSILTQHNKTQHNKLKNLLKIPINLKESPNKGVKNAMPTLRRRDKRGE